MWVIWWVFFIGEGYLCSWKGWRDKLSLIGVKISVIEKLTFDNPQLGSK
jgi:hypothetical protein